MKPEPTSDTVAKDADINSLQCLAFTLGDEVFALDIRNVREILQYGAMTVVPCMPPFVRGVINLRGSVVPVIDMLTRFSGSRARIGKKTSIIILDAAVEDGKMELGLLVDAVSEVIAIPSDSIQTPPQFGSTIPREFIKGIGKHGEEFIVIVEPDLALNIEEMAALTESESVA
ncbi:MAG: chemotaxis protein CheW [Burkholderiales bacterium]|nr:chemotaxis protein CheW [Burkholderiales bacterium]